VRDQVGETAALEIDTILEQLSGLLRDSGVAPPLWNSELLCWFAVSTTALCQPSRSAPAPMAAVQKQSIE
jgi:hypothetical protein